MASVILPRKTVQEEWDSMVARIKEVARVIEYVALVDNRTIAHIITDPVGSDLEKLEEILFWNLLFRPIGRVDDGDTIEISGEWLWSWRRFSEWTMVEDKKSRWLTEHKPELRMYNYQLAEQVAVEL